MIQISRYESQTTQNLLLRLRLETLQTIPRLDSNGK